MPATQATARKPAAPYAASADAGGLEALEAACFGGGLPDAVENEIKLASLSWNDAAVAEAHLHRAYELAPRHPATHIALYRFYFYRNRLQEALLVGLRCLIEAARVNDLSPDWRLVHADHAEFASYSALPRFYLFTLKACVYLRMRLGEIELGAQMLDKLLELDPADRANGSVLRGVLDRMGREDDE